MGQITVVDPAMEYYAAVKGKVKRRRGGGVMCCMC